MSDTKFVKGTWSIEECDLPITECTRYDIIAENGGCIAETFCEFDAHLIAAAPDMYKMLEESISDAYLFNRPLAAKKIESLLSKARGE